MNVKNVNKTNQDVPVMVFSTENKEGKIHYSIGISKKLQDNSYENAYIPVVFNKDIVIENKTKIIINNAIIDFYKKDNNTIFYLRIFDFSNDIKVEDEDLPF